VKKEGHKDEATAYTKGKDNNTAKLSYRDVLVNGRNKEAEDFMERYQQSQQNDRVVRELLYKAMVEMSLLPKEEYEECDLENHDDLDDLPDMPQEELTEAQQNQLIWESLCESYKGTKAGEYFSEAFRIKMSEF
jgi:hypothetical protein